MENVLLSVGCSHASGSEIDGSQDSVYNRQHSFGNVLGNMLGYRPINIGFPGATNATIARGIHEWFLKEYNPAKMSVFVLIAWSDATRMELPSKRSIAYNTIYPYGDWNSENLDHYQRMTLGYLGDTIEHQEFNRNYHNFIAVNEQYLEIASVNLALQLQYFFSMHQIKYLMCNAISAPRRSRCTDFYLNQIDSTKYLELSNANETFYVRYRNAGHVNPLAKYWHHGEIPHGLYAGELLRFIESNKCL